MRTLLNLNSGEVRVCTPYPHEHHSPDGDFMVVRRMGSREPHVMKVLPTYDAARDYAHGFVNYLRRHDDADLEI